MLAANTRVSVKWALDRILQFSEVFWCHLPHYEGSEFPVSKLV